MMNNGPKRLPRQDELPRPPAERLRERLLSGMRARRVVSGIIDLQLAALVMWLILPLFGIDIDDVREFVYKNHYPHPVTAVIYLIPMLLKDIARSPGKRIMKLKLTDGRGRVPVWKRMLRNLTVVIWPVEAIAILVSCRRLTDRILGLNVVDAAEKTETTGPDQV